MHGSRDVEWQERVAEVGFTAAMAAIVPVFDAETVRVLDDIVSNCPLTLHCNNLQWSDCLAKMTQLP